MNRILSILVAAAMSACNGPEQGAATPPPATTDTPGTPRAASASTHNKATKIWMHKNNMDGDLPSPCLGTVVAYVLDAKRNEIVRWRIENDEDNGCPGLTEDNVELQFANAIWLQPPGSSTPTNILKATGEQILARIVNNETAVPNGRYKYLLFYTTADGRLQASPDPEVDVDGSCPGCGGPP
jgi:hypothetical protein